MSTGRNRVHRRRAVVLAFLAVAFPAWVLAQHGMGRESDDMLSDQEATRRRELATSVHKNLSCWDCHGEMGMEMGGSPDPVGTCASCHERAWAAYRASVHAVAVRRDIPHAPTCVECHGSHGVRAAADPLSPVSKFRVSGATCARCHGSVRLTAMHRLPAGVVPDYQQSFHGLSAALGDRRVANCASCHGYHEIRPSRDPRSSVNPANLERTCGSCHAGAGPGFASGGVHHRPDTTGHRMVDLAAVMYRMMIGLTVGLMLAHNAIDFWRRALERWRRRRKGGETGHRRRGESGADPSPAYVRFTVNERLQHWVLAASFGVLVLTGFALVFSWRVPVLEAERGVWLRAFAHRAAAVTFMGLAVYHIVYVALTRRGRYNLRALVPRLRSARDLVCRCAACLRLGPPSVSDWRDLVETVKYNLGLRPTRPAMGRFTYAEKMEYLALVWGSVVMILTGLALWFEVPFLNRFPYWAFDLATVVHYYEAVLATLAILVWHFYYTIFNPDVFPLSKAMVTGELERDEMEREHPQELKALEEGSSQEQ
jgi:cytochrome b subunit of formate dehydrogenase